MKIGKYAALVKKKGCVLWVNTPEDGVFVGTGASMYKAGDIPSAESVEQVCAILDIDAKKAQKMLIKQEYAEGIRNIRGIDMADCTTETEIGAERMKLAAIKDGMYYAAIKCKDGETIFFDDILLLPIIDKLKDEMSYINYAVRINETTGARYVVVKDGFNTLAAIMPVRILTDQYIQDLQDFLFDCKDQLEQEKRQEAKKKREEAEQNEQLSIDEEILNTEDPQEPEAGQKDPEEEAQAE